MIEPKPKTEESPDKVKRTSDETISTADANSRGRPGRLEARRERARHDLSDLKGAVSGEIGRQSRTPAFHPGQMAIVSAMPKPEPPSLAVALARQSFTTFPFRGLAEQLEAFPDMSKQWRWHMTFPPIALGTPYSPARQP
jgi:hypothetical protein